MRGNEDKEQWTTVGVVVRTPNPDNFLRELTEKPDIFVVFSKKSMLKIKLVEEGYK